MENSIKLIVSDVDSTLLMPGCAKIEDSVFSLIRRLDEKNIKFCVASGRTYEELKNLFNPVKDIIYFMPLDGALTIYKEEIIAKNPIEWKKLLLTYDMMKSSNLLFYAKEKTYFIWQDDNYEKYIVNPNHKNISRLICPRGIKEEIYKVTFCNEKSYSFERYKSYVKNNKIFDNLYEDKIWCDFIKKGVNKGEAVKSLMKTLNIAPHEAMAFGDNTNDIALVKSVRYSYAMENAVNELKTAARYKCSSVEKEIERMVF